MATPARLDTPPPLRWDGAALHVLDQTRLPAEEVVLTLSGAADTAAAIRRLAVRGAPLIGVAAAYGLAMEVTRTPTTEALERGAATLAGARPTARNLGWAVERIVAAVLADGPRGGPRGGRGDPSRRRGGQCRARPPRRRRARSTVLPPGPVTVMTHCNSGALAASGRGTGLGVIAELADRRPVQRAGVRGAAAAAGRAADRVGAAPPRDRACAAGRRGGGRAPAHAARRTRS